MKITDEAIDAAIPHLFPKGDSPSDAECRYIRASITAALVAAAPFLVET